jgi:hypothetical protein
VVADSLEETNMDESKDEVIWSPEMTIHEQKAIANAIAQQIVSRGERGDYVDLWSRIAKRVLPFVADGLTYDEICAAADAGYGSRRWRNPYGYCAADNPPDDAEQAARNG